MYIFLENLNSLIIINLKVRMSKKYKKIVRISQLLLVNDQVINAW